MSSEKERGLSGEKEDESEDESEVLEESPCGRWQKRKEQVNQGNMPGIESTFLAMDTEEGVEVVWNELQFTDKKIFKAHEEKIRTMFENLMVVDHPNVVKFHKYWLDVRESSARVVFITEYVSSGSLKQFLKKTKKNHKTMNSRAWKRWCTQILSALSFLHSCDPPIIHGNLTSDTIFIQHNGLIKIGSVWHRVFANELPVPDELRSPVKVQREEQRTLHFFPPEYGCIEDGTAVDIFSFGMCALEMAVLELQGNGDTKVSEGAINIAGQSLEDPNMREFIIQCLSPDAKKRPTANSLLFHRVLFEVHSLKLLSAHCFINNQYLMPENSVEEKTKLIDPNTIVAEIPRKGRPPVEWRYSQISSLELDKFLEDVRNGIYPLMNFAASRPHVLPRALSQSQEEVPHTKTPTPEPVDVETRKIHNAVLQYIPASGWETQKNNRTSSFPSTPFATADKQTGHIVNLTKAQLVFHAMSNPAESNAMSCFYAELDKDEEPYWVESFDKSVLVVQMQCNLERNEDKTRWHLTLSLKLEDKLHRQLSCDLLPSDSSRDIAAELVHYGFIHEDDCQKLTSFLEDAFHKHSLPPCEVKQ